MKKFCCGDVVPGWSPVSENSSESTLYEAFTTHTYRDHTVGCAKTALPDELRSNLSEAAAA